MSDDNNSGSIMYEVAGIRFRVDKREYFLYFGVHCVKLEPNHGEILRLLIENKGSTVHPSYLAEKIFPSRRYKNPRGSVYTALSKLRKQLDSRDNKDEKIIEKVPDGYQFIADVRIVTDSVDDSPLPDTVSEVSSSPVDTLADKPNENLQPVTDNQTEKPNLTTVTASSLSLFADARQNDGLSTFQEWLQGAGRKVTLLLLLTVSLTLVASSGIYFFDGTSKKSYAHLFVCIVQIVTLFILIFYHIRGPKGFGAVRPLLGTDGQFNETGRQATGYDDMEKWHEATVNAKDGLERFRAGWWKGILVTWLFLYAALATTYLVDLFESRGDIAKLIVALITPARNPQQFIATPTNLAKLLGVAATFFNNFSTLCFFFAFDTLNKPTATEREKQNQDSAWDKAIIIVFGVAVVEAMLILMGQGNFPATVLSICDLASGVAAGVTMAMFFGRLQSKFLGPPTLFMAALYSYTSIQALYYVVTSILPSQEKPWVSLFTLNFAFILKCALYLYMAWLFQSGRLLFYFVRVRRTYLQVEKEWQDFRSLLSNETQEGVSPGATRL